MYRFIHLSSSYQFSSYQFSTDVIASLLLGFEQFLFMSFLQVNLSAFVPF